MIAPRVKTQAKSQNYSSRAWKLGILCICSLSTFEVTIKFEKRLVFQFLLFCKKVTKSLCKAAKNAKILKLKLFVFNHISSAIQATEMYSTSSKSSWKIVFTFSLSFDSRRTHLCVIKHRVSLHFFKSHFKFSQWDLFPTFEE